MWVTKWLIFFAAFTKQGNAVMRHLTVNTVLDAICYCRFSYSYWKIYKSAKYIGLNGPRVNIWDDASMPPTMMMPSYYPARRQGSLTSEEKFKRQKSDMWLVFTVVNEGEECSSANICITKNYLFEVRLSAYLSGWVIALYLSKLMIHKFTMLAVQQITSIDIQKSQKYDPKTQCPEK